MFFVPFPRRASLETGGFRVLATGQGLLKIILNYLDKYMLMAMDTYINYTIVCLLICPESETSASRDDVKFK